MVRACIRAGELVALAWLVELGLLTGLVRSSQPANIKVRQVEKLLAFVVVIYALIIRLHFNKIVHMYIYHLGSLIKK